MVRHSLIGVIVCLLLAGCKTVYIPKEFFGKYSEISKDKNQKQIPFKINGAYIAKFKTILSSTKDTVEYTSYSFDYANHLSCGITIPLQLSGHNPIINEEDLINAIKDGSVNDRLDWGYYEIKKDKIYEYNLNAFIPGTVIFGYTLPISVGKTNIVNDTLLTVTEKGEMMKKFIGIHWKESDFSTEYKAEYFFKPFPVKPDLVNNVFMKRYNKFLETGDLIYK